MVASTQSEHYYCWPPALFTLAPRRHASGFPITKGDQRFLITLVRSLVRCGSTPWTCSSPWWSAMPLDVLKKNIVRLCVTS